MAISKITGSALDKDVIMKDVSTADGSSPTLTLQTGDTNIEADDVLGTINFQAPDEGTGTDAILVAAGIAAVSEGDFSASNNATKLSFRTGASETATEKMTIASDGKVTITRDDNGEALSLVSTDADASVGPILRIDRQSASAADGDLLGKINFVGHNDAGTPEDIAYAGITAIISDASDSTEDGKLAINTVVAGTERSRIFIDASETVFNEDSIDLDFRVESNDDANAFFVRGSDSKVAINNTDFLSTLHVRDTGANSGSLRVGGSGASLGLELSYDQASATTSIIQANPTYTSATSVMKIRTDGDGNPNQLVLLGNGTIVIGKSASDGAVEGHEFRPGSFGICTVDGGVPFIARRIESGTAGHLIQFQNVSGDVGMITTYNSDIQIANQSTSGSGVYFEGGAGVLPANVNGRQDNSRDLGNGSFRWDDVFATNTSITTSDVNEKQDIEELTDAEKRVAVVAKGLMRKYRWKDAVEKKGDDARIHFGIIAQDLKDAFEAESLDPSKYAMFCSDTWWQKDVNVEKVEPTDKEPSGVEAHVRTDVWKTEDEAPEDATKKTRLGVRYPELLAFIIASI